MFLSHKSCLNCAWILNYSKTSSVIKVLKYSEDMWRNKSATNTVSKKSHRSLPLDLHFLLLSSTSSLCHLTCGFFFAYIQNKSFLSDLRSDIQHSQQKIAQNSVTAMANWWDNVNESTQWQNGIFFFLCGAYALVSAFALVRLSFSLFTAQSRTFFLQVSSRFMFWRCLGQTLACLNCHSSFRGGLLSWDIVFVINQYKKEGKLFSNSISLILRRYENINSITLNLNYTQFITLFCVDIFYLFTNWFLKFYIFFFLSKMIK